MDRKRRARRRALIEFQLDQCVGTEAGRRRGGLPLRRRATGLRHLVTGMTQRIDQTAAHSVGLFDVLARNVGEVDVADDLSVGSRTADRPHEPRSKAAGYPTPCLRAARNGDLRHALPECRISRTFRADRPEDRHSMRSAAHPCLVKPSSVKAASARPQKRIAAGSPGGARRTTSSDPYPPAASRLHWRNCGRDSGRRSDRNRRSSRRRPP